MAVLSGKTVFLTGAFGTLGRAQAGTLSGQAVQSSCCSISRTRRMAMPSPRGSAARREAKLSMSDKT